VRRRGNIGRENEVIGAMTKLERQKAFGLGEGNGAERWARTFRMEIKSLRTGFLPSSSPAHLVEIVQHEFEFC